MITVILPAKDIPIGSTVQRIEIVPYHCILMNNIQLVADGETFENETQPDCLFTMRRGSITSIKAVPPLTLLEWKIRTPEEYEQLKELIEKDLKCL